MTVVGCVVPYLDTTTTEVNENNAAHQRILRTFKRHVPLLDLQLRIREYMITYITPSIFERRVCQSTAVTSQ